MLAKIMVINSSRHHVGNGIGLYD